VVAEDGSRAAEAIVVAEHFGYRYAEGDARSLVDVSLELDAGSLTIVAGPSGSGKSTLLRAACGLVPHFYGGQASGKMSVAGLSLREHGPSELAAVCGTLFQDPESQVVMGAVRAEIALGLEQRGESAAAVARAVEETALALGVAHLLDRRTDTLSGGELQRVALAATLVNRPALVLLDEPTSQLDPVAGDELIGLLRRLNEEWGTTVVVADHRIERWLVAADQVVALERGRIARVAAPTEYLDWLAQHDRARALPAAARLFASAGLRPLPTTVKQARASLQAVGLTPSLIGAATARPRARNGEPLNGEPLNGFAPLRRRERPGRRGGAALRMRGLWYEIDGGPAVLRGIDLELHSGDCVALIGRNGAGKSTLLRHAKGLLEPTRGSVERAGEVALLLQTPGDYLIHEHVEQEAGVAGTNAAGLRGRERTNPRDLSGGERQRLALEVVLGVAQTPALVCLDEPTRGMDCASMDRLVARLEALASAGAAVIVATHDMEFAAAFAGRVVLMGEGVVLADGPAADVLAGGWYFTTEVARVLGGAGGALTPEQGARRLAGEGGR